MTAQPEPYTAVLAYETPAELPPGAPDSPLVVVVDPPAVYLRSAGVWVPVASVEGNIPTPTVLPASEAEAGIAELATQEETNAGADTFRIVTPARLSGRTATEARSGVVELATAPETVAGTDAVRAVHPAGMKAAMTPEAWIAPTLLNGWVNFSTPHEEAGYRKTPWGEVQLRGSIKGGTTTGGTVLLNLPANYRPVKTRVFTGQYAGAAAGRVDVEAGGNVLIYGAPSNNSLLSLEAVRLDV